MKKCSLALLFTAFACSCLAQQKDYTRLVNVFIGTGGHGHIFPGASMPFGMVQLSPDTRMQGWDACGGYYYADSAIYGFSHTHLSGTGIPDYCDILLMPSTGKYEWDQEQYKSPFSHASEKAYPGFYSVHLDKDNIDVALTATVHAGLQEYRYSPDTKEGNVLIDLRHGDGDRVIDSWLQVVNDSTVIGKRESSGWAKDQILFFALKFSRPVARYVIASNDSVQNGLQKAEGKNIKAYFSFDVSDRQPLYVKVAISAVSPEGAMKNLDAEMPGFDFKAVAAAAKAAWNKELGRIDIEGGPHDEQVKFYSALYHTCLAPNVYEDVDGQFRGTDLKVHHADGFTNYTVFSLWDTYRALNPLMTIIDRKIMSDWINTFLAQYKYGGMTPIWELSGNETFCMIGHHSVPVIVDAYQKGIRGFDASYALEAIENYDESNRAGLPAYRRQGYLGKQNGSESTSRTLEYAYDDWCIAQMAKMLGKTDDYDKYIQRAQYYKNVYDASTGFMRGKTGAMWLTPFDPREVNHFYTEANAWQYNFAVQQDVDGLIQLHGGREKFASMLNELFTTSSTLTGDVPPDIAGMIGQYAHGDEPSHHMIYLFNYVGMPWRTQELVHQVCTTLYRNDPDGESGNDDCGQMSAWLVLSDMGIYQVCPGDGEFEIGTPMFDKVSIHLENGKTFTIKASHLSPENFYIQSASFNGKAYPKSFITYNDIMKGGELDFNMGGAPNKKWAAAGQDCPHRLISHQLIVPVPYVSAAGESFAQSSKVSIGDIMPGSTIYYTTDGSKPDKNARKYTSPFSIDKSCTIKAVAYKEGLQPSRVIEQDFHKTSSN